MTKFQLFSALACDGVQKITVNGITGILSTVQREDGTGHCFNVTLIVNGGIVRTFVRTID